MKYFTLFLILSASLAFGQTPLVNGKGDGITDAAAFRAAIDTPSNAEAVAFVDASNVQAALAGDPAAARASLGLGTAAVESSASFEPALGNPGIDGYVLSSLADGTRSWTEMGGGGLENLAETLNTSAPNATIPVAGLAATNAATHVDIAIVPKGNGALIRSVPDGTSSGGDKRGIFSTDFQKIRNNAAQVASGSDSFLVGRNNTASGSISAVVGGDGNTASNSNSAALGGANNTASGIYSGVLAGVGNTASGLSAVSLGGQNNVASGQSSLAMGGGANTRSLLGAIAHSAGNFSASGDSQRACYVLSRQTTDATQTELSMGGSSPAATTRIVLPNNHAYKFRGQAIARESATGDVKTWDISGTIKRGANAAATSIVGSVSVTVKDEDAGASAWALAIDADATNGTLRIQVTGEASHTIRWLVTIETVELG